MIVVKDLAKSYFVEDRVVKALNGIDIHIEKSEIFGVIGLSGAGKSSLVRVIGTIEKPTSGEVFINGKKINYDNEKELTKTRKKIGMIFQHFNLLMNRTVYENIAFPLEIHKYSIDEIDKRVKELLEIVGLEDKADDFPNTLSGGQKQRVGIARALATNPDILICDEATSALDPVTTQSVLNLLKDINKKLNITILVVTHEMDVIKSICNKVAILEDGKVIEVGDVVSVFVKPETETAKTFFEDKNMQLSNDIYKKILDESKIVLKINFIGDTSVEPYISNAIKRFDVDIAILAGNIQDINNTIIGSLIVEINGADDKIKKTLDYFDKEKLLVEVVKDNVNT